MTPEPVPDSRNAVSPHFFHDPRRRADGLSPRGPHRPRSPTATPTRSAASMSTSPAPMPCRRARPRIREARQKAVKLLVERMVAPEDRAKVPQVRRAAARQHGARRRVRTRAHRGHPLHRHHDVVFSAEPVKQWLGEAGISIAETVARAGARDPAVEGQDRRWSRSTTATPGATPGRARHARQRRAGGGGARRPARSERHHGRAGLCRRRLGAVPARTSAIARRS